MNHEHILTLCEQDFVQPLASPGFKYPPVISPSVMLVIQVGRPRDVTLVHVDLRLPSTGALISTPGCPWKQD